jgi:hypothetical protein
VPIPGRAPNPGLAPGAPGRPGPPGPPGPVGNVRVGCIGLRAPGLIAGRCPGGPPGAAGRGRSKIGRPRWIPPAAPGAAVYVGRGPVCGITTSRTGCTGAAGGAGASAAVAAAVVIGEGAATACAVASGLAILAGAVAAAGGALTTMPGEAGATTGGGATTTGALPITGPEGGLLAMAGVGGNTAVDCGRGSGTILRGAGAACPAVAAGAAPCACV